MYLFFHQKTLNESYTINTISYTLQLSLVTVHQLFFWHTNDNDFHQAGLRAATTYGWDGIATFGASEERSERRGGAWDGVLGVLWLLWCFFGGKGRKIRLAWLFGTSEISRVKQNQPLVAKGRPVLHIGTEEVLAGRITKHGTEWNCIDIPLISIHCDRENATCSSYMYIF